MSALKQVREISMQVHNLGLVLNRESPAQYYWVSKLQITVPER